MFHALPLNISREQVSLATIHGVLMERSERQKVCCYYSANLINYGVDAIVHMLEDYIEHDIAIYFFASIMRRGH